jgi:hypothetical protein
MLRVHSAFSLLSVSAVPLKRQGVHHTQKNKGLLPPKDTPPYKTFPFVLGSTGALAGIGIGMFRNRIRFHHYENQVNPLPPQERRLDVKEPIGEWKGLVARYDYMQKEEDPSRLPHVLKDSGHYLKIESGSNTHYVAETPLYIKTSTDNKHLDLRHQQEEVNHDKLLERSVTLGPDHRAQYWGTVPDSKNPGHHQVRVELHSPVEFHPSQGPQSVLAFVRNEQGDMHLQLPENKQMRLTLDSENRIQESSIEALNGLHVWFDSGLRDIDAFAKQPERYINDLKKGIPEIEKHPLLSPAKWGFSLAAAGYSIGWVLEWFSRKKANEALEISNTKDLPTSEKSFSVVGGV